MTLARILLISICWMAWISSMRAAEAQQPGQSTSSAESSSGGSQEDTPKPQTTPVTKPVPPGSISSEKAAQPKTTPKKTHRKKKRIADCSIIPESGPAASGSTSASASPAESNQGQNAEATKKAPCPPPKIVVHQGGTSDSSIQLAGGPGSQSSQANATAGPMLEATEANLKKLEGRQLSETEQDMVTQIRQFMQQSKTAVAAGDVERARTLAWKAQTLSEDLVKPEK